MAQGALLTDEQKAKIAELVKTKKTQEAIFAIVEGTDNGII